jgi:hypothetical protein
MVGPLGALSAGPAAATTEFEEDVNGGPHGGLGPILPPNTHWFLQSKAWKAVIVPMKFLSRAPGLRYT